MTLLKRNEREVSIAAVSVAGEFVQVVVHRASGLKRLGGLIGSTPMEGRRALHFPNCRSVHGCFMDREIFVVFLDGAGVVTSARDLKPWRFVSDSSACQVLEFESETAADLGLDAATKFIFANKG